MEGQKVDHHLQQAIAHLREALDASIRMVLNNQAYKAEIGQKWEMFLGQFFGMIKSKGKENKVNLLNWIKFPRMWKW